MDEEHDLPEHTEGLDHPLPDEVLRRIIRQEIPLLRTAQMLTSGPDKAAAVVRVDGRRYVLGLVDVT